MAARLGAAGKKPRALEHKFDPEPAPGKLCRIALRQHADAIAVHDHRIAVDFHFARKLAVRGVIARQMSIGLRVSQIVDGDDLDFAIALGLIQRPQNIAPDATVTVDTDFDGHVSPQLLVNSSTSFATLSAVKPKCGNRSDALPDSPKRSMPSTRPSEPT